MDISKYKTGGVFQREVCKHCVCKKWIRMMRAIRLCMGHSSDASAHGDLRYGGTISPTTARNDPHKRNLGVYLHKRNETVANCCSTHLRFQFTRIPIPKKEDVRSAMVSMETFGDNDAACGFFNCFVGRSDKVR